MFRRDFKSLTLLKAIGRFYEYRTITFSGLPFQAVHHIAALVRVRSALLAESLLLSFPAATEMFQFAAFAPAPYTFRCR